MNVRICGPNLRDQSKGQFHVHHEGCADLRKYGPQYRGKDGYGGDLNGNRETLVEYATYEKCVLAVYDNGILDERREDGRTRAEEVAELMNDFWFAPCCAEFLQHSEVPDWDADSKTVYECWINGVRDSFRKLEQGQEVGIWVFSALTSMKPGQSLTIGVHTADEYTSAGDATDPRD